MIELKNITFDHCLKCSVCNLYCPVAKASSLYPGPKQSGPDTERLRIKDPDLVDESLVYCNNCKRCEIACPSEVKIADIILRAKARLIGPRLRPRDYLMSQTDLAGSLGTVFAPLINQICSSAWFRNDVQPHFGFPNTVRFPAYAQGTFARSFKKQAATQEKYPHQVIYFHGCYVNYFDHELGWMVVKVLNSFDIGVRITREKCCGVPLIANGYLNQARQQADHNITVLSQALQSDAASIVSASSTCAWALRHEYPNILEVDNSAIADRVEYITRFINQCWEQNNGLTLNPLPLTVAYHAPCHLIRQGGVLDTMEMLRRIPGLKIKTINADCCGLSGTYGFKKELGEIAQTVGQNLFRALDKIQPDLVITDCETCRWQIEMNTPFRVLHPVTLLASALP
ncbi:MAG: anaerobic glycerol-3-phosphate dehydrogenase subunit C [Deltaproteobacteria bacterium]|nr:anaerobic glycerol-3-phosphate dehydrogenase subunit C [Deltaproteobacteria bacterium]